MWLEAIPEPAYNKEKCPTCGSYVRRRSYGQMYAGSQILNGKRVEIRKRPRKGFIDPVFLDPITQYFNGRLFRVYPSSQRYFAQGGKLLHRLVWEDAFGPVPKRCHIHHRNGDISDNHLSNLECIPMDKHLSDNWKNKFAKREEHFTSYAREKATEWHRSEAGRLWHKRQAKRSKSWTKWKREKKLCPVCNKEFMGLVRKSGHSQIYCSPACKSSARRLRRLPN